MEMNFVLIIAIVLMIEPVKVSDCLNGKCICTEDTLFCRNMNKMTDFSGLNKLEFENIIFSESQIQNFSFISTFPHLKKLILTSSTYINCDYIHKLRVEHLKLDIITNNCLNEG